MGALTVDKWQDVGYMAEPIDPYTYRSPTTLETWLDFDPVTGNYTTRIGRKPEVNAHCANCARYEDKAAEQNRNYVRVRDELTEVNRQLTETKASLLKAKEELAEAIAKRDEYDAEADDLYHQLARAATIIESMQ